MKNTLQKLNKRIYILESKNKIIQKYYFNFFLSNDIDNISLALFVLIKEKYLWLLEKQSKNLNEAHAFINLNHLRVSSKIESIANAQRLSIKFEFADYELDKKFPSLDAYINNFFQPINLSLLNEENKSILKDYLIDFLENEKFEFNDIDIQKNQDIKTLSNNFNILLNKYGYNLDIYNIDIDSFINNLFENISKIDSDFFEHIIDYKIYFRVANRKMPSNLIKLFEDNFAHEKINISYDLNENKKFEYKFKDFVSISQRVVYINDSKKLLGKIYASFANHLIWTYYFDVIREQEQLIYSPSIKYFTYFPTMLNISNKTQNNNISKLENLENKFFNNFESYITNSELDNFKQRLFMDLENSKESEDIEFYISMVDGLDQEHIDLKFLESNYKEIINDLNITDAKKWLKDVKIVYSSITRGK